MNQPSFERIGRGEALPLAAYIDGSWHDPVGSGADIVVEDPATLNVLARFRDPDPVLVGDAVDAASKAYRGEWGGLSGARRGQILQECARAIRANADLLARLETLDTGKPLSQSRGDVELSAKYCEYYAGAADKIHGSTLPSNGEYWAYELREPHGVVAHITPWNSPLSQMCRGVAPCLAAGNTVVVKPSELTPLTSLAVASLFVEAGLPHGACNVVPGCGPSAGAALVRHAEVAHVTFTGSVPTGKDVMRMAADRVVGCNLELGGKSPTIVLADADVEAAVRAGALAVVRNAGQSCFATTRLVVHRSIADDYARRVAALIGTLSVGPGIDDPDLGPLASAEQLNKVLDSLDRARAQGAHVLSGGVRPPELKGHFVTPALLTGVVNDMDVAQQEVFGPVQSVLAFDDLDEAVAIANGSTYGLAAGVFTRDLTIAHDLARRLEAGQIQINQYPLGGVDTAFGGYKQSGIGREKGLEALHHYTQLKTVIVRS